MITIQSALFLALGFLVASLLWLLAAPAFWSRAVRLTARRMRETMPITEAEIRADKDRLRAEYALKIHQQQLALDETKLATARQLIELNRRDAKINALEADVESLTASLEGAVNARGVLEQTIAARLPRVEERLMDAKRHLQERDKEISDLTRSAERQARALQEAEAINEQLKSEVKTLTAAAETAGAKARGRPAEDRTDSFVSMRAELDTLRARTREQTALIDRLQKANAEAGKASGTAGAKLNGGAAVPLRPGASAKAEDDTERKLREARKLAATREQEIAILKASVAVYEKAAKSELAGAPESRIALKASLGALEEKTVQQEATIAALKTEVAALQEQLTRQTAGHAAEVGRLGAGTLPVAAETAPTPAAATSTPSKPVPVEPATASASAPRERRAVPRLTLAERVAQSRRDTPDDDSATTPILPSHPADSDVTTPVLKGADTPPKPPAKPKADPEAATEVILPTPDAANEDGAERRPSRIKSRLLDRISDLSKA